MFQTPSTIGLLTQFLSMKLKGNILSFSLSLLLLFKHIPELFFKTSVSTLPREYEQSHLTHIAYGFIFFLKSFHVFQIITCVRSIYSCSCHYFQINNIGQLPFVIANMQTNSSVDLTNRIVQCMCACDQFQNAL